MPFGDDQYGPRGTISLQYRDVNGNYTSESEKAEQPEWKKKLSNFNADATVGSTSAEDTTSNALPAGRGSITVDGEEYEILRNEDGDFRVRRLADGKAGDPHGNIYILANSIPLLEQMDPVKSVTGNEMQMRHPTMSENIVEFFNSEVGGQVEREGFGTVLLDGYGAQAFVTRAHHPTKAKLMAIVSVPEVIQKGKLINSEFHKKHMSYTFAAPVDFMGKPIYVAAIVHDMSDAGLNASKFYLDEIVDCEGYRFNVENIQAKESNPDPKSLGTNSGTVGASREMLSMGSIS